MLDRRLLLLSFAMLATAASLPADVVILRNGDRIEGEVVERGEDTVSIRRSAVGGQARYVQRIPRRHIVRIEDSDSPPARRPAPRVVTVHPPASRPAAVGAPASRPAGVAATQPAEVDPVEPPASKLAMLDAAIEHWQARDWARTAVVLSRLINNTAPGELAYMSQQTQDRLGIALAELAADARFRTAQIRTKGATVKFTYVTQYEKPALIPLIADAYEAALTEEIRPPGMKEIRPPAAGPTPDTAEPEPVSPLTSRADEPTERESPFGKTEPKLVGLTIAEWLDHPEDFNGSKPEAEAFEERIIYATSLLTERIRLDLAVRRNQTLKAELVQGRVRLAHLLKAVRARAKGALTPDEREVILTERKRLEREYRRQMAELYQRHQIYLDQAVDGARQQEQAQAANEAATAIPDWLLPQNEE